MPTYDYECLTCHHKFERFHSMTAEPESQCPECGGPVKKLIGTGAGLLFRGSGFYITDYRSEGYKKQAKSDGAAGEGTGATPASPSSTPSPSPSSPPSRPSPSTPSSGATPSSGSGSSDSSSSKSKDT